MPAAVVYHMILLWFLDLRDHEGHIGFVRDVENIWWEKGDRGTTHKNAETENCSLQVSVIIISFSVVHLDRLVPKRRNSNV